MSDKGRLKLIAPKSGTYELFKIAEESPFQLISDEIGNFNQEILLEPGNYLVLADCSSETVIINPGSVKTLLVHTVNFTPPHPPQPLDKFLIQCDRFEKTGSRQILSNQYSLNLISGERNLLVNMVPLKIDFPKDSNQNPMIKTYQLSALQVAEYEAMVSAPEYFVSPKEGPVSVTESQIFGQWQFLLPGNYLVEVNGTQLEVALKEKEEKIIKPAFLRINTSKNVDLSLSSKIKGTPHVVEINSGHSLSLNETYPVLPGTVTINLGESNEIVPVDLKEGSLKTLESKSVLVEQGLSKSDWSSLGKIKVFLYHTDQTFSFMEGTTDVPILFLTNNVWIDLQGSRGLMHLLSNKVTDNVLKVGTVIFEPINVHKPGQFTDLIRVETEPSPTIKGHSIDIPLVRQTEIPLIAGKYYLAHYISLTNIEGERRKVKIPFTLEPGEKKKLSIEVYSNKKKVYSHKNNSQQPSKSEVQ